MESLTTLELNRAILSVVREALELHVTQHDSLEPVVELHLPCVEDPDIGGVPRGPHQGGVTTVLNEDVWCPNMVSEVILSIDHFETCDIGKVQTIILQVNMSFSKDTPPITHPPSVTEK